MFKVVSCSLELSKEIADLFHSSVHAIESSVYSLGQKEAWAPTPPDYEAWAERLEGKQPFLAMRDDQLAGFIELDSDGHIDCFYVHPDFQGQGIGSLLYERVLQEAHSQNLERLYVEASKVARPFFGRRGFQVLVENEVCRAGVCLVNFSMELRFSDG